MIRLSINRKTLLNALIDPDRSISRVKVQEITMEPEAKAQLHLHPCPTVGIVSAGRDPKTGDHRRPKLELTRLAIPRRVYTQAHMDVVAEAIKHFYDQREHVRGLKMVYVPQYQSFFQAWFEPIS